MGEIRVRNKEIEQMMAEYKECHDRHFPKQPLTDTQWRKAIAEMDDIADKYRDKDYAPLSYKLNQAFLDDIEMADKIWKEFLGRKNAGTV